jgi:cytosine deaminase
VFALAHRWGTAVDFHIDFTDDPAQHAVDRVIQHTLAEGLAGQVAVGHLTSLAAMTPDEVASRADGLAAAGIHVIALPATDLFLGGRAGAIERPGSLTPIALLAERGVNVCLGTNNIQNAFTPMGRPSPLTMAWLGGVACHLGEPASHQWLLDTVTSNAAAAIGYPRWDLTPGAPADMALLDTDDATAVVSSVPQVVGTVHAGRFRTAEGPRHRPSLLGGDNWTSGEESLR